MRAFQVCHSFVHPSIPRVHTREHHVTHTSVRDVCPARAPSGHPPAPQPRTVRRVLPCAPAAPSAACPCVGVHAAGRPSRRSCPATTCGAASFSLCVVSFLPPQPPPGRAELRAACQVATSCPGPLPVPACSLRAGMASASPRAPRAQGRPPPRRRTPTRYPTVLPICVCYLDNFR